MTQKEIAKMINRTRRNFWGTLSILITVVNAVMIFASVRYLYWRGLWHANPSLHAAFGVWGGLAFLLSLTTAIIAVIKDSSRGYATLAIVISIMSLYLYTQ
jgi:hypothetical protein